MRSAAPRPTAAVRRRARLLDRSAVGPCSGCRPRGDRTPIRTPSPPSSPSSVRTGDVIGTDSPSASRSGSVRTGDVISIDSPSTSPSVRAGAVIVTSKGDSFAPWRYSNSRRTPPGSRTPSFRPGRVRDTVGSPCGRRGFARRCSRRFRSIATRAGCTRSTAPPHRRRRPRRRVRDVFGSCSSEGGGRRTCTERPRRPTRQNSPRVAWSRLSARAS